MNVHILDSNAKSKIDLKRILFVSIGKGIHNLLLHIKLSRSQAKEKKRKKKEFSRIM